MDGRGGRAVDANGADPGAAERRLAEALRAQASLGGRVTATPQAPLPLATRGGPPAAVPHKAGRAGPAKAHGPKTPPHPKQPVAGPPHGAPSGNPHPGRAPGGGRPRDHADAQPTEQIGADAALAGAPTTQHASPLTGKAKPPAPVRTPHPVKPTAAAPPPPAVDRSGPAGGRALPLHWLLLAGLLAGVLLGCLLAGLSVLDSGLFPALG